MTRRKPAIKDAATAPWIDARASGLALDGMSIAASLVRCDCTAATICGDRLAAARRWLRSTSNVRDITMPKLAIASKPATLETALLTPDATPTAVGATDCMTVVVSGATVNVMPNPSTTAAGKNVAQ